MHIPCKPNFHFFSDRKMASLLSGRPMSILSVCLKFSRRESQKCCAPSNSLETGGWNNLRLRSLRNPLNVACAYFTFIALYNMKLFFPQINTILLKLAAAGGGVPGHAGEQWSCWLRSGGAEGDGPVLLRADC